jgi:hypothetical protein
VDDRSGEPGEGEGGVTVTGPAPNPRGIRSLNLPELEASALTLPWEVRVFRRGRRLRQVREYCRRNRENTGNMANSFRRRIQIASTDQVHLRALHPRSGGEGSRFAILQSGFIRDGVVEYLS